MIFSSAAIYTTLLAACLSNAAITKRAPIGFRTVGSSGVAVQMVFLPPNSNKAVFIDNYHVNQGGPGYDWRTNKMGSNWIYDGTTTNVFGSEFDLTSMTVRALRPKTNTFCSAGAFYSDGTLLNLGGAEPETNQGVADGFQVTRTFAPGRCSGPNGACTQDWIEGSDKMLVRRWYLSAQTLTDGGVLLVGGSSAGGLFANCAQINQPNYEKHYPDGRKSTLIDLPLLKFDVADNQNKRKAWNLYPILHLIPNCAGRSLIFQLASMNVEVWDYDRDKSYKTLPESPNNQPRTFPSMASSVLLPLRLNNGEYAEPTVLVCGGSSADGPDPVALNDCWTIQPMSKTPQWIRDDDLPLGGQTMSDGILLPDGKVLLLNGARIGAGGGQNADDPVLEPVMYTPWLNKGERFARLNAKTSIPRMYHSVATLLPSGEVLIAGGNSPVGFDPVGKNWWPGAPIYTCDGKSYMNLQQKTGLYPTEYRVEIFSPPYMNSNNRPIISAIPSSITLDTTFTVTLNRNGQAGDGKLEAMLSHPGFSTHGVHMGQRMIELIIEKEVNGIMTIRAPPNYSYAPAGWYLLFVNVAGWPSEGKWIKLA